MKSIPRKILEGGIKTIWSTSRIVPHLLDDTMYFVISGDGVTIHERFVISDLYMLLYDPIVLRAWCRLVISRNISMGSTCIILIRVLGREDISKIVGKSILNLLRGSRV